MSYIRYLFETLIMRRKAKRILRIITERSSERIDYDLVYKLVKEDNQNHKNAPKVFRNALAEFYLNVRKHLVYKAVDYTEAMELYFKNKKLGIMHSASPEFYLNRWVTVITPNYAYKGRREGEYHVGGFGFDEDNFEPYTFLVTQLYGYRVNGVGEGWAVDKNCIRLATPEEIQREIDKQFILGEN